MPAVPTGPLLLKLFVSAAVPSPPLLREHVWVHLCSCESECDLLTTGRSICLRIIYDLQNTCFSSWIQPIDQALNALFSSESSVTNTLSNIGSLKIVLISLNIHFSENPQSFTQQSRKDSCVPLQLLKFWRTRRCSATHRSTRDARQEHLLKTVIH